MRPRPILFAAATLGCLLALIFAGWSASNAQRAQQAQRNAERALADARMQRQEAAEKAAAEKRRAAPVPVDDPTSSALTAAPEATTAPDASLAAVDAPASAADEHARKLARYRATLDETWGLLIAHLGLTAEQTKAFKDLLCRREENDWALESKAEAEGLTEDSPAISALDDAFLDGWKAQLRDMLGRDGYAAYREYFRDRHVAPLVTELAAAAYDANVPLPNETALATLRALGNASQRKPSGTALEDTVDWPRAMEALKPLLSADQASVFETIATRRQSEQKIEAALAKMATTLSR